MNFTDLKSALKFKTNCPFCKSKLKVRTKEHAGKVMGTTLPELIDNVLYFKEIIFDEIGYVSIDIESNKIKAEDIVSETYKTYFQSLRMECMSCWQYFHKINLNIDTTKPGFLKCSLNNICIKRIINNYEYRLTTSKSFGETIFSKLELYNPFFKEKEDSLDWTNVFPDNHEIVLPFIDINLDDPDETILKIEELIIFA